ncbi:MAG: hypothetical protein EOP43_03220 [Sphingobacteriaceae bacterium]|nr:MAG: hypothetical protein EOP43_03220 [Sphingobacteriaceae bacterium]
MLNRFNFKEKPPKERFLFILGLIVFVGFFCLGLMIMFWQRLPLRMSVSQRYLFGSVTIIYAIIRFARLIPRK